MITKDVLGARIRELRKKAGKSQKELGDAINKTHAAISDIERGKTDLSVRDLSVFAEFLNVSISFFTEDCNSVSSPTTTLTMYRDGKNISKEEKEAADKMANEFLKLVRELNKR